MNRMLMCWLLAGILFASPILAQTITASLEGDVHDQSGAVVPGAKVRIVNTQTNVAASAETNVDGRFVAPALQPGRYNIVVEAAGFKRTERTGIELQVNQSARIDLTLEVGALTETIEVSGQAPLLEATSATMGQVVDNRSIVNLPLNQRNAYALAFITPGVIGNVGVQFNDVNISINGGRPGTNEILTDGIPSSPPAVNVIQVYTVFPPVDAVREFKVQTNTYSAEFGRSGGGIINLIYKSGTNELHGSAFEFMRNSRLDSNDFYANSRGLSLASFKRNQFGATAGGPVILPRLYNGRNRTFFFGSFEGLRQRAANNALNTVPTDAMRAGDFSGLRTARNEPVAIYDPVTTTQTASGAWTRQAFPGNLIPVSRMDPVGRNVLKYYPPPNNPGDPYSGTNNWVASGAGKTDTNQYDVKVDENINDRNRFFARFSHRKLDLQPVSYFPPEIQLAQNGVIQQQISNNAAFDYTWNVRPTFLADIRWGFGRMLLHFRPRSDGFDPTQLGFPSYVRGNADRAMFPGISPASYLGIGNGGGGDFRHNAFETHNISVNNSQVMTSHVLKFGFEIRLSRVNNTETGNTDGDFSFSRAMTQGPDPNRASNLAGDSIASLLLGLGSGNMAKCWKCVSTQSWYYGWYFGDDWKVSRKLTLNLGLRYELDLPRTERYNRVNVFDTLAPSPLAAPSGIKNLTGGLVFAGVNGQSRRQFPADTNNWAPRFGFAYQARKNTVVRGGYGIFYSPSLRQAAGTVGNFGYRSDTSYIGSVDGVTPSSYLRDPFPTGFTPVPGNTQGLLTGIGTPVSATLKDDSVVPYTQNYSLNLQHQLPGAILVEAGYVGNRGVHLNKSGEGNYNLNQLRPEQLALGNQLQQQVNNPFFGQITTGPLAAAKVPTNFLLRPYPQFTTVNGLFDSGNSSTYNSFQLKVEKRFSSGLSLLLSYTNQKLIDNFSILSNVGRNAGWQNIYDQRGERAISSNDVSQKLVLSYVYALPFGRGNSLGKNWSRAVDALLGGWQMNGITTLQTGQPLALTTQNTSNSGSNNLRPNNNGKSAALSGRIQDRLSRYFDTSVFSQPAPFLFGNTGRTLPDARGPGGTNFDFSLFKNFRVVERVSLQFRAESFNFFNTPQFNFPNQNLNQAQFGAISDQANSPRQMQLALKVLF